MWSRIRHFLWRRRTQREYAFQGATEVVVEHLMAKVVVETTDSDCVFVQTVNDSDNTELSVELIDGKVRITDPTCDAKTIKIVSGLWANLEVLGRQMRVRKASQIAQLVITVPIGTKLVFRRVEGPIAIGDTQGEVGLEGPNSEPTRIGRIRSLWARLEGVGAVTIAQVDQSTYIKSTYKNDISIGSVAGRVTIRHTGLRQLNIKRGMVQFLDIQTNIAAKVAYYGSAQRAKLVAEGGEIKVGGVEQELSAKVLFAAMLAILEGNTTSARLYVAGRLMHRGSIDTVDIRLGRVMVMAHLHQVNISIHRTGSNFGLYVDKRPQPAAA